MHMIDKHEKKLIYSFEKNKSKGPRKMIWLFLFPSSFLEVVLSGTTQGYFHPIKDSSYAFIILYYIIY
jgi:hypothetical protein